MNVLAGYGVLVCCFVFTVAVVLGCSRPCVFLACIQSTNVTAKFWHSFCQQALPCTVAMNRCRFLFPTAKRNHLCSCDSFQRIMLDSPRNVPKRAEGCWDGPLGAGRLGSRRKRSLVQKEDIFWFNDLKGRRFLQSIFRKDEGSVFFSSFVH